MGTFPSIDYVEPNVIERLHRRAANDQKGWILFPPSISQRMFYPPQLLLIDAVLVANSAMHRNKIQIQIQSIQSYLSTFEGEGLSGINVHNNDRSAESDSFDPSHQTTDTSAGPADILQFILL